MQATFLHFWNCPKSKDVNRSGDASIHHRFGLAFDAIYHQLGASSIKNEQQGVPTANHRMDKVIRQVECLAGLAIRSYTCQNVSLVEELPSVLVTLVSRADLSEGASPRIPGRHYCAAAGMERSQSARAAACCW